MKFITSIFKGIDKIISYKLIGPIMVLDVWMVVCFWQGIYLAWGNSNAVCGLALAVVFYTLNRLMDGLRALDRETIEDATTVLAAGADALEYQSGVIKALKEENERLKAQASTVQ